MKGIAAVLAGILLALSLAGCSKRADNEQSALTSPDFMPLNSIEDGRKNIYLIVKNLDSSYWKIMIEGAKDGGTGSAGTGRINDRIVRVAYAAVQGKDAAV